MRLEAVGVPITFDEGQEATAELIRDSVERTAAVLKARWDLTPAPGSTVHVMADAVDFLLRTAPRRYRLWLRLTQGLWRGRVRRLFPLVGGWTIPWKTGAAVGIKPMTALESSTTSLGAELFVEPSSTTEKLVQVTAHEFTHACTAQLRLPQWQNEGVAMRAVDHVVGYPTVRESTRALVVSDLRELESRAYRRAARSDPSTLLKLYATGYWLVRSWDERGESVIDPRVET